MGLLSPLINKMKKRLCTLSNIPAVTKPLEQSDPLRLFDKEIVKKINLLGDELYDVYKKAQKELVAIGSPAVEPLIYVLKNQNAEIGERAAECLGEIGDSRALQPLIETLQNMPEVYNSNEEYELRRSAAIAIGGFKTPEAAIALLKVLEKEGGYTDKTFSVQGACIQSLGRIGDPIAIKPLSKYLENDYLYEYVKPYTIEALGNIQDPEVKDLIVSALATSKHEERVDAVRILKIFTGEEILDYLLRALQGSGDVRVWLKAVHGINDLATSDRDKPYFMNSLEKITDILFAAARSDLSFTLSANFKETPEYIFGDFSSLIIDAAAPYNRVISESENPAKNFDICSYVTSKSLKAIKTLCGIDSQISTNILHKVLKKKDVRVLTHLSGPYETYENLTFEEQRTLAENELLRRGRLSNCDGVAIYDPSAYLEVNNWVI